jgi:acyl carrier protein
MNLRKTIEKAFHRACEKRNVEPPPELEDDLVLLQSGLDSLGFAILVTTLEMELGYDPFTLTQQAVYPRTFGEFVSLYERFADRVK